MKAKLIKTDKDNYILVDSTKGVYDKGYLIGSSRESDVNKLSKQNCDELFGVVDVNSEVEDIVKTICPDDRGKDVIYGTGMAVGIQCFNKAMELNKDKVFTLEDINRAIDMAKKHDKIPNHDGVVVHFEYSKDEIIQSLQQPTEIEVEIVCMTAMNTEHSTNTGIPKLDSEGRLILKKL
jgi:hypothetical protein